MSEENEILSSSTFFNRRRHFNHVDMDAMAYSPPTSETSPIIYIRKPSRPENLYDNAAKDDSCSQMLGHENKRKESLGSLAGSYRSHDNLSELMKTRPEILKCQVTRSLPPSPMITPCSTPEGSPKIHRHQIKQRRNLEELWNTQLWFYPSIFRSSLAGKENTIVESASRFSASTNSERNFSQDNEPSSPSIPSTDVGNLKAKTVAAKKKFVITNRDMNFLAPTST